MRERIALALVRLASRIDTRPDVSYSVNHHHPKGWQTLSERDLRYGGQVAGIGAAGVLDTLVGDGPYASKGTARRALGIEEPLPPMSGWLTKVVAGLAGSHPAPPNT